MKARIPFPWNLVPCVFFLLIFCSSSSAQLGPGFHVEREKVLSFDMYSEPVGPYAAAPFSGKSGVVWSQRVIGPEAVTAVRLHVRILLADTRANWKLLFKDLQGREVDSLTRESGAVSLGEYWSDEIRGRGGIVELWTDTDPAGLELQLDKYAFHHVIHSFPLVNKGLTGVDDRMLISRTEVPEKMRKWANPVARLRFMVSNGREARCTGFLLSDDLLITNEHCIQTQSEVFSAIAEFGYDSYDSIPDRYRARALEIRDRGLDYALIRLASSPASKYGKVILDPKTQLAEKFPLVVIEHPDGQPKQVSITGCQVSGARRSGVTNDPTDFGHLCDTLIGSSGSPVIDLASGAVVGLHHLGFTASSEPVNQAVYLGLILKDIQQRKPSIYQEIIRRAQ